VTIKGGSRVSPVAGVGINGFEFSTVTVVVILFDSDKINFKVFKNSILLEDMELTYDKPQVLCFWTLSIVRYSRD
jgi:hypothetical protein